MDGKEALELLETVEEAGVFHGYLEDLCYTPKNPESFRIGAKRSTWTDNLGPRPGSTSWST